MTTAIMVTVVCAAWPGCAWDGEREVIDRAEGLAYLRASKQVIRACDVWYEVRVTQHLKAVAIDETSRKVTFRRATDAERQKPVISLHRFVMDGDRRRFDEYDHMTRKPNTICVISRTEWTCKDYTSRAGPTLTVKRAADPPGGYARDYRELLTTHFQRGELVPILEERQSTRFVRTRDGEVVIVADAEPDRPVSSRWTGYRVVLDPRRALMAREKQAYEKGQVVYKTEVHGWHERAAGVHAPIRGTSTGYCRPGEQFGGEIRSVYEFIIDVSRSTWNQPIDPGVFELTVDAGMPVYDMVKGVMTLGGKSDPGQNIDELAKHAMKYTKTAPVGQVERSGGNRWAVVGCVAAGLAVVGWVAWRFVRRGA